MKRGEAKAISIQSTWSKDRRISKNRSLEGLVED